MRTAFKIFLLFFLFASSLQAQTGSITGRVSNGAVPLTGFIELYKVGAYQDYVRQEIFTVGSNGVYTFSSLADGAYIVRTLGASEQSGKLYLDEVYDNKPCSIAHCDLAAGTPVIIGGGATVQGVDFVLEPGSQISGQVNGAGISFSTKLYVSIYNQTGELLSKQPTDTSGTYSFGGVAVGTYYVTTANKAGFVDELYGDISCPNDQCVKTSGTPIVVTQPESSTTINFDLARGGSISGTVRSSITRRGVNGVPVDIYNSNGVAIATGISGSGGVYKSEDALPDGVYYARTNTAAFQNQLYKSTFCTTTCNPLTGKAITVSGAAQIKNVNFSLDHISNGPSIDLTAQWKAPNRNHPHVYTLTILNTGANTAGGFTVTLYKSATSSIASDAKPFKKYHFGLLPRKSKRNFNLTLNKSAMLKYVIAVVDSDGVLPEKNKRNNIVRKVIT